MSSPHSLPYLESMVQIISLSYTYSWFPFFFSLHQTFLAKSYLNTTLWFYVYSAEHSGRETHDQTAWRHFQFMAANLKWVFNAAWQSHYVFLVHLFSSPVSWVSNFMSFSLFSSLSHNPYSQLAAYVTKRIEGIRRKLPPVSITLSTHLIASVYIYSACPLLWMKALCSNYEQHFHFSTSSHLLSPTQGHCNFFLLLPLSL